MLDNLILVLLYICFPLGFYVFCVCVYCKYWDKGEGMGIFLHFGGRGKKNMEANKD